MFNTFTNFSTKYLMMCKVYTDVGGIKYLYGQNSLKRHSL